MRGVDLQAADQVLDRLLARAEHGVDHAEVRPGEGDLGVDREDLARHGLGLRQAPQGLQRLGLVLQRAPRARRRGHGALRLLKPARGLRRGDLDRPRHGGDDQRVPVAPQDRLELREALQVAHRPVVEIDQRPVGRLLEVLEEGRGPVGAVGDQKELDRPFLQVGVQGRPAGGGIGVLAVERLPVDVVGA